MSALKYQTRISRGELVRSFGRGVNLVAGDCVENRGENFMHTLAITEPRILSNKSEKGLFQTVSK